MPIITVKFTENVAGPEVRQELIRRLTDTFVDVVGEVVRPFTQVVLEPADLYDWGIAGRPMPDPAWLMGDEYKAIMEKSQQQMGQYLSQASAQENTS